MSLCLWRWLLSGSGTGQTQVLETIPDTWTDFIPIFSDNDDRHYRQEQAEDGHAALDLGADTQPIGPLVARRSAEHRTHDYWSIYRGIRV